MSTNTDSHDMEADERRFAWAEKLDLPEELKEYAKMYPEYFQFGLSSERTEYEHSQFRSYVVLRKRMLTTTNRQNETFSPGNIQSVVPN